MRTKLMPDSRTKRPFPTRVTDELLLAWGEWRFHQNAIRKIPIARVRNLWSRLHVTRSVSDAEDLMNEISIAIATLPERARIVAHENYDPRAVGRTIQAKLMHLKRTDKLNIGLRTYKEELALIRNLIEREFPIPLKLLAMAERRRAKR